MKNYIKLGDKQIEITDKQIEQFKKMLTENMDEIGEMFGFTKKKKHWVPKIGEMFYCINLEYKVVGTIYYSCRRDNILIATGNYYRTNEEACQKADKKLKYDTAVETVKRWIEDEGINNRFVNGANNHTFGYDYFKNKLNYNNSTIFKHHSLIGYLRSEEDCQKLLKALPEEMEIIFK